MEGRNNFEKDVEFSYNFDCTNFSFISPLYRELQENLMKLAK